MAQHPLQHYLRTYRRRSGFSQSEMAVLLGASSGTKISRYENFDRHPSVATMFALEIIFERPVRDIFAGRYEAVRQDVRERARRLAETLSSSTDLHTTRKLVLLRRIMEPETSSDR